MATAHFNSSPVGRALSIPSRPAPFIMPARIAPSNRSIPVEIGLPAIPRQSKAVFLDFGSVFSLTKKVIENPV
jgi:hypothetical protein